MLRVLRGASWINNPDNLLSSYRDNNTPGNDNIGFQRVVAMSSRKAAGQQTRDMHWAFLRGVQTFPLLPARSCDRSFSPMTAGEIIKEIQHLAPVEQAQVVSFVRQLDHARALTGQELVELANKLTVENDPKEAEMLKERIAAGFYGKQ